MQNLTRFKPILALAAAIQVVLAAPADQHGDFTYTSDGAAITLTG